MIKEMSLLSKDGKTIYGTLYGSLKKPLIIFVHGLFSHKDETLLTQAAEFFLEKGYASFSFNLYDGRRNARKLVDTNLRTYASDIDTVVQHFKGRGAEQIVLVGHSYGCPSILLSKSITVARAVMLWDPAYKISFSKYVKKCGSYYFMEDGLYILLGKKLLVDEKEVPWATLGKNIKVPLLIVCAEKSSLLKTATVYLKRSKATKKKLVVIPRADHNFTTSKMRQMLYVQTERFLKSM